MRSSASVSAGEPTVAAAGLVTDTQPRVGVLMVVIVPAIAATEPLFAHVAVTSTVPSTPIATLAGKFQIMPFLSRAEPFVIVVPAVPVNRRSAVEFVATFRVIPLIFTLLLSAAACAVIGENEL